MPQMINPLRYPGAKRMLIGYIGDLVAANNLWGCRFIEPYAGSAVVGLELLRIGTIGRLDLVEKDVLVYAFWESVFHHAELLCERVADTPVTIETWHALEYLRKVVSPTEASIVDLGYAGLFFNRTNFSGILQANPIGGLHQDSKYPIDCRFNKNKLIDMIRGFAKMSAMVSVHWGDALEFMTAHQDLFYKETCFAYFDPPYYEKGALLYRHSYSRLGHLALAHYVSHVRGLNWLISYDDAPFICGLYGESDAKYRPFFTDYSAARDVRTTGKELLISNLPLPPFPVEKVAQL